MIRVALLLFDDVDLLDVGGPYEVFLTADRLQQRENREPSFAVTTASPDGRPVVSYGGTGLTPHVSVDDLDRIDVLVVPGAIKIAEVCDRQAVKTAVAALVERSEIVSSVCTGAFLLGDQNLLDGIAWTTHFEDVDDLAERIGSDRGDAHVGWVDAGWVVTSGGLSSGIAMALHLVDRLAGRDLAIRTAAQIEYDWTPD